MRIASITVLVLLSAVACDGVGPEVEVENRSSVAMEDVTLKCGGAKIKVGSVAANETKSAPLKISGSCRPQLVWKAAGLMGRAEKHTEDVGAELTGASSGALRLRVDAAGRVQVLSQPRP